MIRRPPRSTRTDTLFPYTTLFRSNHPLRRGGVTSESRPSESPAELPEGLEPYRQTDVFTATSLPAGLRKDHCTKPGVWGLIQVAEGRLRYCVTDLRRVGVDLVRTPGSLPRGAGPMIRHHVVAPAPVPLHVQVYG